MDESESKNIVTKFAERKLDPVVVKAMEERQIELFFRLEIVQGKMLKSERRMYRGASS